VSQVFELEKRRGLVRVPRRIGKRRPAKKDRRRECERRSGKEIPHRSRYLALGSVFGPGLERFTAL
jgi:hypothetical protein